MTKVAIKAIHDTDLVEVLKRLRLYEGVVEYFSMNIAVCRYRY